MGDKSRMHALVIAAAAVAETRPPSVAWTIPLPLLLLSSSIRKDCVCVSERKRGLDRLID